MTNFGVPTCQEKLLMLVSKMCQGCACGQSRSGCVITEHHTDPQLLSNVVDT